MNKKVIFIAVTIFLTSVISIIAYEPPEVIVIGPSFHEQNYFEDELNLISEKLGIKIKYLATQDPETFIVENPNNPSSIAIIPNAQGVINLAERKLIHDLNDIYIDNNLISETYSNHLTSIVSYDEKVFAGWIRLFPNSLIWYDVSKIEQYDIDFNNFDNLIKQTKKIANEGISPWCANSESSSSTGWIQTNWLEDVLLSKYGPEIYDRWARLEIDISNVKLYSSIKVLEDYIFHENHIYGGFQAINNSEFRNLPEILLNDDNECFLSWSGHYFRYYIPDDYQYRIDFDVVSFPKINLDNTVVGIGDNIVLTRDDNISKQVISEILSKNFGEMWSSNFDSEYISANKNFDESKINNELTKYEYFITHKALREDLFRYDASELMPRPIGSDKLWKFFQSYIYVGPEGLVELLNNLDKNF